MRNQSFILVLSWIALVLAFPLEKRGYISRASWASGGKFGSTGSPVAQKSFNFPQTTTEHKFLAQNPDFHRTGDGKNMHFGVGSCHNNGRMCDGSAPWNVIRDVPCICPIGNFVFWFFADTFSYSPGGKFLGAASNSVSLAKDPFAPSSLSDISVSSNGKVSVAIPWTDDEAKIQFNEEERWVLWPFAPCIPIDNHHAAHLWTVNKFHSKKQYSSKGYSTVEYTTDDYGNLNVSRKDVIEDDTETYAYGNFASVIAGQNVYLYALDIQNSGRYDIHVACAPRESFYNKTTWTYWDSGANDWSSEAPDGTVRNESKAAIVGKAPFSTGSVFWSDYHNSYLCVFFNNWADSTFYLISSPSPVGPWNMTTVKIHHTEAGENGFNYGGQASPAFYSGEGEVGQKLVLSYTYNEGGKWYPTTDTLTFA